MKKFNVDTNEAKRILLMHKALMKEQTAPVEDDATKMRKFIRVKCLKSGGKLYPPDATSNNRYYYVIQSAKNPELTVTFYSDMSFTVTDKNKKVIQRAKWSCDNYVSDHDLETNRNWKTREQLKDVTDSDLNNDKLYTKHPKYDLWMKVGDINSPVAYTLDQKMALAKLAVDSRYFPENEFEAGTVTDVNCQDITRFYPQFGKTLKVCNYNNQIPPYHKESEEEKKYKEQKRNSSGAASGAASGNQNTNTTTDANNQKISDALAQQPIVDDYDKYATATIEKDPVNVCRSKMVDYYTFWLDSQRSMSQSDFMKLKSIVQRCVDLHNMTGNNIFSRGDNKSSKAAKIMTGGVRGEGPSQYPEQDGRVWFIKPSRRK